MNIESIIIVKTRNAADHVFLHTNFLEACYPYTEKLTLSFTAAKGSGEEYCTKHFPGIPVKTVGPTSIV